MSETNTVASHMAELKDIVSQVKQLNHQLKDLRDRKKILESKILEYLESTDAPGLKFQELIVMKSDSTTHTRKKKKDKEESVIQALESNGVTDSKKVYDDITRALVGEQKQVTKLRVKQSIPEIF